MSLEKDSCYASTESYLAHPKTTKNIGRMALSVAVVSLGVFFLGPDSTQPHSVLTLGPALVFGVVYTRDFHRYKQSLKP